MAQKLYDIFPHVNELKTREPEYFVCEEPITGIPDEIIGDEDSSKTTEEKGGTAKPMSDSTEQKAMTTNEEPATVPVKTFVSILEEGCKKYYAGAPPIFALDQREMLIERDSFKEFGIGKTREEAMASLENLMAEFQKSAEMDGPLTENWVGKVNERCQKLKLQSAEYEITEEGPPNQRIFTAKCKIGKEAVTARGKTKKIAKTLAAQRMYQKLDNWKDPGGDPENAGLAAAQQEVANENIRTKAATKKEDEDSIDLTEESVELSDSVKKIRAAFQSNFGAKGLAEKLHELIKSGDENINDVFPDQELKYMFLAPATDGDKQCVLSVDGPNGKKNVFHGFGSTEMDAKDYAARNALVYLELFIHTPVATEQTGKSSEKSPSAEKR